MKQEYATLSKTLLLKTHEIDVKNIECTRLTSDAAFLQEKLANLIKERRTTNNNNNNSSKAATNSSKDHASTQGNNKKVR